MDKIDVEINLGEIEFGALNTEEEIRAEARKLVPKALRKIGEASAETLWIQMQKAFRGSGFKANHSSLDKRKFIEEGGKKYARETSSRDKQELEDYIVEQIRAQKSRSQESTPHDRSEAVVFDIEQHERDKLAFLEALYTIVQEYLAGHPNDGEPTLIDEHEGAIGQRAGLTRQQARRVNGELEHEGMTEFVSTGEDGPRTSLTHEGLKFIERHLYERAKQEQENPPAPKISADQVKATLKDFEDLASDLMQSDSSTFTNNFNHLYEFIESDAVMRIVTADLRDHPDVDIDKWLKDFEESGKGRLGSHTYSLPRDKSAQAATIFQLFRKTHDGDTDPSRVIASFAINAYGITNYNDCIYKFNESITHKIIRILEQRLEELAQQSTRQVREKAQPTMPTNRVFIVHGHDDKVKETVARFVEKLGLEAIILHEQANRGQTIIEKFERHADVGFAVILLTPDDVGASKAAQAAGEPLNDRARQNVVFELGYFIGKLGRPHVCALHEGVEIPSDLHGLVYVPYDAGGVWRYHLAKEMKASGMDIDMNKSM